jgi:hypothetical protein
MLVTFSSKVDADILMLGDHAKAVLSVAGKNIEGGIPERGVFSAEQLPDAIHKIEMAIEAETSQPILDIDDLDELKPHPLSEHVRLGQRAYPLLHMMKKAQATKTPVLWEAGSGW